MTLISLEEAKAEVRKVVSDFKTRYDINYRLNSLPSIELEDEAEPQTDCDKGLQLFADILFDKDKSNQFLEECKAMGIEPQTEREGE